MNVMKTLIAATALAVVSTHAMAQVSVPPPPYSDQIAFGTNSGVIFSLFSVNPDTPFSYVYSLGLTQDALAQTNGMQTPGVNLPWALPSLSIPGTVSVSDLRWTVTAPGQGNARTGGAHLLTTAALGADGAALAALTTSGAITTTAGTGTAFIRDILNNAANPGTPDISTTTGDPLNALTSWNATLGGLPFNVAGGVTDALSFFLFTSGVGNALPAVSRYQAADGTLGQWALNLAAGTLTYSINAVPLPAGVWLLLSGLAGMGVVGRRRNKGDALAAVAA